MGNRYCPIEGEKAEKVEYKISYDPIKAQKVVELQRLRGGLFEMLTACRLPWVEVGLSLDYYPKLLKAITGVTYTWDDLYKAADRVYSLIRAYWVREFNGKWDRKMDYPPKRWFTEGLKSGPHKGEHLDEKKYDELLSEYYRIRGWDERGIPKKETLKELDLDFVIPELEKVTNLE